MKKEQLTELGLTDEQIAEVFRLNGLAIEAQKARATALEGLLEQSKTDLQDRDSQLEKLKELNPEELQAQITSLQETYANKENEYKTLLQKQKLDSAINLALQGKVHDLDIAQSLFDREKLIIDGDKILGLNEQLEKLQKEKAFLFVSEPSGFQQIGVHGEPDRTSADRAIAEAFGNVTGD